MEYESRMEQHYAVSKSSVLTHITDAHNSNEDYFCPHCGCRMMKKCGNIRAWHFAHDYHLNDIQKECSYESYLHAYAKLRLQQWFNESPNIILHYRHGSFCKFDGKCKWQKHDDASGRFEEKSFDLKKSLTKCTLEETVQVNGDCFRTDLYWSNPDRPQNNVLVEINVTHECTTKKKESLTRIIEFDVHSEEDVDNIIKNDIRESKTVRYFGFNLNQFDDGIPAGYQLAKFVYYKSGNAYARSQCNCQTYMKRRPSALVEVTLIDNHNDAIGSLDTIKAISYGKFYNWGLCLAMKNGFEVKNCYLCSLHKYNFDDDVLKCDLNPNSPCEPKDALRCMDYCLDKDFCDKNLEELNEYAKHNVVDFWLQR